MWLLVEAFVKMWLPTSGCRIRRVLSSLFFLLDSNSKQFVFWHSYKNSNSKQLRVSCIWITIAIIYPKLPGIQIPFFSTRTPSTSLFTENLFRLNSAFRHALSFNPVNIFIVNKSGERERGGGSKHYFFQVMKNKAVLFLLP